MIDNAVDEHLAGHNDHIELMIHPDNSLTVVDHGRGIRVGVHDLFCADGSRPDGTPRAER